MTRYAVCADVGSTYTKAMAVELATGTLAATASRRTTVDTDVLHGLDAAVADLSAALPGADLSDVRVCSSAGGGLRLAVVGYEALVTAEAGHRVGLSAGARVVHVASGRLDTAAVDALHRARPDIVLLVGGTDGGDAEVLRHNAGRLAASRLRTPVVVAGNADARDEVTARLAARGKRVMATDNVLPRIGHLNPTGARAAIREVFLRHVIGGKRLSRGTRFTNLVRGPTPDVMLTAVELLADAAPDGPRNVVVVDVGGATTDVYSVVKPTGDDPGGEVAGTLWHSRTVEADLGVRWSATGVVSAAQTEGLLAAGEAEPLYAAAEHRTVQIDLTPSDPEQAATDRRLAELAMTVALRRHARGERIGPATAPRRGGKDLREVSLLVGSGGVLRHTAPEHATTLLSAAVGDHAGGWQLPVRAELTVDRRYVLAAAGLLAADRPDTARRLLRGTFWTV